MAYQELRPRTSGAGQARTTSNEGVGHDQAQRLLVGLGARRTEGPSWRWVALAFIALAQLMVALDATVVNIALPSAQAALAFSDADRQWVISAYTLAFGGLLFLGGRI